MKISIISPVYKGENLVRELVSRCKAAVQSITPDFEIILVEDGSPDNSWAEIAAVCESEPSVKGVKLSRNFGQHYAITAGLKLASGDWIVVMDCDLQDQPEEIIRLYQKAQQGFDIVFAQRKNRMDGFLKKLSSKLFYWVLGYLTETKQDSTIANFGIYSRQVIQSVLSMNDYIRYFPTMVQWVGFSKAKVDVSHSARKEGKSSYTWGALIRLATRNIIGFSDKPLRLTVTFGMWMSLLSLLTGAAYLFFYLTGHITVIGYTSIIISITFLSGLIIMTLGIIGTYLGRTFEQVKQRPTYIIHKLVNSSAQTTGNDTNKFSELMESEDLQSR